MGSVANDPYFEIPTHCKAGVVVNEGPNFHIEIQTVAVPEPGGTEEIGRI
jgi:propanol-preferring alcohol dehydrogenase